MSHPSVFYESLVSRLLRNIYCVRLAEWSKAPDLSSGSRKRAWVRTPHLTIHVIFFTQKLVQQCDAIHVKFGPNFSDWLQWRNRLAHGTYRQYNWAMPGLWVRASPGAAHIFPPTILSMLLCLKKYFSWYSSYFDWVQKFLMILAPREDRTPDPWFTRPVL